MEVVAVQRLLIDAVVLRAPQRVCFSTGVVVREMVVGFTLCS